MKLRKKLPTKSARLQTMRIMRAKNSIKVIKFYGVDKHVAKLHNKELEQGDDGIKEKFREDKIDLQKDKMVDFTKSMLGEFIG